jgi:hypothetical protein
MRKTSLLLTILLLAAVAAEAKGRFDAYIYRRGGTSRIYNGGKIDFESTIRMAKQWEGDFLWFRTGADSYLIRDSATLDEIARLFAPMDALRADYRELRSRLRPVERRERAIERQIDRLEDAGERSEARVRELERDLRAVEREIQALEDEEAALDRREDTLEREAERAMIPVLERAVRQGLAQRER